MMVCDVGNELLRAGFDLGHIPFKEWTVPPLIGIETEVLDMLEG
jgi:hypothetical protein